MIGLKKNQPLGIQAQNGDADADSGCKREPIRLSVLSR